ncbi:MAG: PEP-CTERM sorting domain-containing protein [Candidatus Methylumidiphilus sp.]
MKYLALVVLGMTAGAANAAPLPYIIGGLSITGALNPITSTLPGYGTTAIVSAGTVFKGAGIGLTGATSGSFAVIPTNPPGPGTTANLVNLDITTPTSMNGLTVWHIVPAVGTAFDFTFNGSSLFGTPTRIGLHGPGGNLTDSIAFDFEGVVTNPGFSPTKFFATYTANGSCNGTSPNGPCSSNVTNSWSASISANGQPVPEPGSLSLMGIGLVGWWAASRRPSAKKTVAAQ